MRFLIGSLLLLVGCASLSDPRESGVDLTRLSSEAAKNTQFKQVAAKALTGLEKYSFKGKSYQAQYFNCAMTNAKATIIAVHTDRAGFDEKSFCSGWIAQAFLAQGFDVIAINRPGYRASDGVVDFAGAQSMAAIAAGTKAALAAGKNAHAPSGVWGYSTGVSAAAVFAKKAGDLKFMILGGGIYDYEAVLADTKDSFIKADLERIKATGGNKAIEDRSISYDVEGFPKTILLYHGKKDDAASFDQAKSFADSLVSSDYQVQFHALEDQGQNLPATQHRLVIETLAKSQLN